MLSVCLCIKKDPAKGYVCVHVCVHVWTCTCMSLCVCVSLYVCVYVSLYVALCVRMWKKRLHVVQPLPQALSSQAKRRSIFSIGYFKAQKFKCILQISIGLYCIMGESKSCYKNCFDFRRSYQVCWQFKALSDFLQSDLPFRSNMSSRNLRECSGVLVVLNIICPFLLFYA